MQIHTLGILVRMSTHLPGQTRQDPHQTERIYQETQARRGQARAVKDLWPPEVISPIKQVGEAARKWFLSQTAAFRGEQRILKSDKFMDFTREFKVWKSKQEFEADEVLLMGWDEIMNKCQANLNGMFDPRLYPASAQDFKAQVQMSMLFDPIPIGSHFMLDLAQNELDHLSLELEDGKVEAVKTAKEETVTRVKNALLNSAKSLSKDKGWKNSAVGNLAQIAEHGKDYNLDGDPALACLLDELARLGNVSPDLLRESKPAKKEAIDKIDELSRKFQQYQP